MQKRSILTLFSLFFFATVAAIAAPRGSSDTCSMHSRIPMNKVMYSVSAERWVESENPKVEIHINASLQQDAVDQLQAQVMANLKKLSSSTDWRITYYSRRQDQSDLERVTLHAQARVPQGALANIRGKANDLSEPGVKYSVSTIEYTPSAADVEAAREALRQTLYEKAKAELDNVNKIYPGSHFAIHKLHFVYGDVDPRQMRTCSGGAQEMRVAAVAPASTSMNVSYKEKMTVLVIFASKMP